MKRLLVVLFGVLVFQGSESVQAISLGDDELLKKMQDTVQSFSYGVSKEFQSLGARVGPEVPVVHAQTIVPMGNLMGKTSVTFGGGDEAVTYSSVLKIDFVPKAPDLSNTVPQLVNLEEGTDSTTATFSITSRANGNANYTLEYDVELTNLEGPEPGVTAPLTIENLGATAVVKVNEDGSLVVPSDGAADAEVNGIEATDKVMIDNLEYTVEAVEDDGATATITLQGGLAGANPSMGTPIWEKQQVTVTLDSIGAVEEEGLPSNVTVTVRASIDGLIGDTTFIASRTVEVLPWARTYVRNTDEGKNPEDAAKIGNLPEENALLVDGKWYFSSLAGADPEEGLAEADYNKDAQVKAAAGDTLEYVIVVSAGNTSVEQEFTIVETFPPFAIGEPSEVSLSPQVGRVMLNASPVGTTNYHSWTWTTDGDEFVSNLAINQSARLFYTLQLGEAEEVESDGPARGVVSPEVLKSDPGTLWVEGAMLEGDTPCWCDGEDAPVGYCTAEGWAAGVNRFDQHEDGHTVVSEIRNAASKGARPVDLGLAIGSTISLQMVEDGWLECR